jgi:hypothetical protein
MLAQRLFQRALCLTVAAFAVFAVFATAVPAAADETAATARGPQAKRSATSFTNALPGGGATAGQNPVPGGLLFFPGPQTGMNIGGRVNVGKSHVYVPYYGNISTDPAHPGVQGTAGLAYGFRTWDISVLNGAFGSSQAPVPGIDQPKVNPSLSLSIRF